MPVDDLVAVMPWWVWLIAFLAIPMVGAWWLWQRVRATWHTARELGDQVAQTGESMVLRPGPSRLTGAAPAPTVFTEIAQVRAETRQTRTALIQQRHAARRRQLPPWARR